MWFWWSASAGLASALDKILNRISLKGEGRGSVVAYSFSYMLTISILSLFLSLPVRVLFDLRLFLLIAVQTIFWTLGTLFSFLSQSDTDVSLSTIISRARILWMIPLGYLFLGERVGFNSIIGMVIVFFGLATLFYKKQFHKFRGIQFMILGSFFVALGSILNAILVKNYLTPPQVTFVTMAGQMSCSVSIVTSSLTSQLSPL